MGKVYLAIVQVKIPVVADSEEEVREFLLEEQNSIIFTATGQVVEQLREDPTDPDFAVEEITEESLDDEHEGWEDLVPWGGTDETILRQLTEDEEPHEEDDEVPPEWGAPSHPED